MNLEIWTNPCLSLAHFHEFVLFKSVKISNYSHEYSLQYWNVPVHSQSLTENEFTITEWHQINSCLLLIKLSLTYK